MWSLICNVSEYVEELQRCIGDASEKCRVQYAGLYSDSLKGADDGNSCKSNPRVVVCTHLYTLSIGNSVGCNEGSFRQKIVKWHIVLQRYQHLRCQCHPNGSKYCIQFTSSNNWIFSSLQIINQHPWLSENYDEWPIPALLHTTLQNCKVRLWHHKLTKSKWSIFHTSFCVYILMKTKPLDANTSSKHERGSQPPAHQGSMENAMMLPQAAQTTLTRLLSQATQTIVLPRMLCQVTQALTRNLIQVNLHVSYSTCISIQILPYCPICSFNKRTSSCFSWVIPYINALVITDYPWSKIKV